MRSPTDHVHEGREQTAETLTQATEQVADTSTDVARPTDYTMEDAGQTRKGAAE